MASGSGDAVGGGTGRGLDWDGLLKWSLSHSDGTKPPRQLSEEDRRWFMEAMQEQTVDVVRRMKEITLVMKTPEDVLAAQGVTSDNIADMLDELQEHVESIDMANDLHSIGGLVPLLGYLKNPHAGIRAKAAEVISTIVQNNPKSQQQVMEAGGLKPLLTNLRSDSDASVRVKSLGAISSLIRHNRTGISAFRLASGYSALQDAMGSDDARLQRKALHLVQYLLHEGGSDGGIVADLGLPRLMVHLAASSDTSVREAALGGLLELVRCGQPGAVASVAGNEYKLRTILESRIEEISLMASDDLSAAQEERQLIDSLWKVCYKEPSLLQAKGLVVLPTEETFQQPPDVAGKYFEPPLRAWAAEKPQVEGEKKSAPPLLLGVGPSPSGRSSCGSGETSGR